MLFNLFATQLANRSGKKKSAFEFSTANKKINFFNCSMIQFKMIGMISACENSFHRSMKIMLLFLLVKYLRRCLNIRHK